LCHISSIFVQKNPKQIKKKVRAFGADVSEPVRIVSVEDESKISVAVSRRIEEIVAESNISNRKIRIYVLGRYRKESIYMPAYYDVGRADVDFMTVHSSKGLEADYVILPRMTSEILGFPSRIIDDPVLQLAMPGGDDYESAEERRLFYVALTRARKNVTLITLSHKESPFVAEVTKEHKLIVRDLDSVEKSSEVCPLWQKGFLQMKKGKYGPFLSCSQFPKCRHTQKMPTNEARKNAGSYQ
jgi:DNA helicase-4